MNRQCTGKPGEGYCWFLFIYEQIDGVKLTDSIVSDDLYKVYMSMLYYLVFDNGFH